MNEVRFRDATRKAESVVDHMEAGELKTVAFRIALERFLDEVPDDQQAPPVARKAARQPRPRRDVALSPNTLTGRILALKDDSFFAEQRGLGELRNELGSRGWHYPVTTLSGVMQRLVQNRELRRVRANEGKKKVWKYSNP
jgi:hypothetical protein